MLLVSTTLAFQTWCPVQIVLTLGDSLAYMEMYMAMAYIVRRFELQLADTNDKDMLWDDMVVPQFHGEFKAMTKRRIE